MTIPFEFDVKYGILTPVGHFGRTNRKNGRIKPKIQELSILYHNFCPSGPSKTKCGVLKNTEIK